MGFRFFLFALFFSVTASVYNCRAEEPRKLLNTGWNELVKDNDTLAFRLFGKALAVAEEIGDKSAMADAWLMMGICSYSVSYSEGMHYALKALEAFRQIESIDAVAAKAGRNRCLQLISTIYSRQGNWHDAIRLSHEVLEGLDHANDTSGIEGLAYNSLGKAWQKLQVPDSSAYYFRKGLQAHIDHNNVTYLPTSFINVADLELNSGASATALKLYQRAKELADSTGNKQAMVQSYLGLYRFFTKTSPPENRAAEMLANAEQLALSLNDKSYLSKVYSAKVEMYKSQNDFENALTYQEKLNTLNDSLARGEREKIVRQLEVQFEVSEMNRQLKLTLQEHKITKLTNYLLWGALAVLLFIGGGIFVITRKMNRRDKQLLETKVALMQAKEEQKKLKEAQMQHEIEFKESQLSAMALQMMQKNDLLKELEEKLGQDTDNQPNTEMRKIISRGWNHDSDWNDFNTVFEGINHNFYARLKAAYPEISPNDLRLCALIKLNMSIKEMAGILNISPDSVKTARYRLRKKLQLNTEDNLTDFIISL